MWVRGGGALILAPEEDEGEDFGCIFRSSCMAAFACCAVMPGIPAVAISRAACAACCCCCAQAAEDVGYCTMGWPTICVAGKPAAARPNGFSPAAAATGLVAEARAAKAAAELAAARAELVDADMEVGVDLEALGEEEEDDLFRDDMGGACSCWTRLDDDDETLEELVDFCSPEVDGEGEGDGPLSPLRRSRTVFRLFLLTVWIPCWTAGACLLSCTGLTELGMGPGGLGAILVC